MVKQTVKVKPERNPLYLQQQCLKPKRPSHPQQHPPVPAILPLRPRHCMPRLRESVTSQQPHASQSHTLAISDAFEELKVSALQRISDRLSGKLYVTIH